MSTTSYGQQRIRVTFNPSEPEIVRAIKEKSAALIDLLQAIRADNAVNGPEDETPASYQERCGEQNRLIALAQTKYEEAAMWAVKAATV